MHTWFSLPVQSYPLHAIPSVFFSSDNEFLVLAMLRTGSHFSALTKASPLSGICSPFPSGMLHLSFPSMVTFLWKPSLTFPGQPCMPLSQLFRGQCELLHYRLIVLPFNEMEHSVGPEPHLFILVVRSDNTSIDQWGHQPHPSSPPRVRMLAECSLIVLPASAASKHSITIYWTNWGSQWMKEWINEWMNESMKFF